CGGDIEQFLETFDSGGIDLSTYRERMAREGVSVDTAGLRDGIIGMSLPNGVFVDCTANETVAGLYEDFLSNGISVVAANKCAASSDYDRYRSLKSIARNKGVKFLFETNVGAGLPVISTINALKNSGDCIEKIEAVMSGSLNYIFNVLSSEIPFSRAVRMAEEAGYSEPDPRVDLSGTDVVRKLVILSREAGCKVSQEDVEKRLFIPKDFFEGSLEEFWQRLPSLDAGFEEQRKALASEGKRWRFVARMDKGHYGVALETVGEEHPLYHLDGSNNIFLLTTERYRQYPMIIKGYGAGADVTAAGVFSDILNIANI
ncbi:MAG: bifunctional aspartate kinase/homoserine dehydrogenase I, partial [Alistipes sp.]|nr:bifunctional aspartate kinase/homoserine dehydrogenase I [Candidatus Minthomonas equi]